MTSPAVPPPLPRGSTVRVEVIGRDFVARGRLVEAHSRLSDHLNERRSMIFLDEVRLEGISAFAVAGCPLGIHRDDILFVVPVEEILGRDDAVLRVAKEQVAVRLLVDEWRCEGRLSLVPGVSVDRFVNVGHEAFVPLTDARLRTARQTRTEAVVLVRRSAIRLLVPL